MTNYTKKRLLLDTSFVIAALYTQKLLPNEKLVEMHSQEATILLSSVFFSELVNALESIHYKQFRSSNPPPNGINEVQWKKNWREKQLQYYENVSNQFQLIWKYLSDNFSYEFVPVIKIDDPDSFIALKKKFPRLDSNDCLHYLTAVSDEAKAHCLVSTDSDFLAFKNSAKPIDVEHIKS